jgi:hypothetical protein
VAQQQRHTTHCGRARSQGRLWCPRVSDPTRPCVRARLRIGD